MGRIAVSSPLLAVILSLVLLGAPAASAQSMPDASSGLSVVGLGTAIAPADTALLQLTISESAFSGPPVPQPEDVQRQAIAPIVQALVDAGTSEDDIEVIVGPYVGGFGGYYGPAVALVRITLDSPTAQGIGDMVEVASTAATDARLMVGGVSALYGLDDCAALERDARDMAIAHARQQGEAMADMLGVSLGDVTSARDVVFSPQVVYGGYGLPLTIDPCGDLALAAATYGGAALPTVDPTTEPQVTIDARVELTFGIEGSVEATPAV